MTRRTVQTNLIGRRVRFVAPGTTHQRDDLPKPDQSCEIVAAHIEDGELCLSILAPDSRIHMWTAKFAGSVFMFEQDWT